MRILYSHRIQSRDGQSVHVEELVAAWRALGHEVRVVGPSFYTAAEFGGESRTIARLRRLLPGALGELAELAYNLPAYRSLARVSREFSPDFIYERYNLYYLAGAWLAGRSGLPYFLEVNSPLAEERSRHAGLKLHRLARAAERHVWRRAGCVLVVTEVLRQHVLAAGVAPERVRVVPNGVVPERFGPPPAAGGEEAPVLGFVGFIRAWHGLEAVIRVLAGQTTGPAARLVVVGEGPARPELEALAASLGVGGRVHFTGLVAHEQVPAMVAGFDIALQPRVVAYASPLKIFDYMAAGRAIVAPDQPNIREILDHERTALLFDPGREGAMEAAITRLLGDASLRHRLGGAARAELERRDFTWRGNAARIIAWAQATHRPRPG